MDALGEALLFLIAVGAGAAAAVCLGMLVAPRLGRLTEPHDEDDGGIDD